MDSSCNNIFFERKKKKYKHWLYWRFKIWMKYTQMIFSHKIVYCINFEFYFVTRKKIWKIVFLFYWKKNISIQRSNFGQILLSQFGNKKSGKLALFYFELFTLIIFFFFLFHDYVGRNGRNHSSFVSKISEVKWKSSLLCER